MKTSQPKEPIEWTKSDAEIAELTGWSFYRVSKKRAESGVRASQSSQSRELEKYKSLAGKMVRLTGEMYVRLLTINPLGEWWTGRVVADCGRYLEIDVKNRGISTYHRKGWTEC